MKSEEIAKVLEGCSRSLESSQDVWLAEIAYQLAIANESAQESRAKSVAQKDHSALYARCREAIASLKNEGRYYVADRLEFELKKVEEL